jgi:hypothetical protein
MSEPSRPGFSDDERRAIACVLDEIIPESRDGKLPGAGQLGLAAHIEATQRATPELRPAIEEGLAALAAILERRGASDLGSLPAEARVDVMSELAAAAPAFIPGLVFHTYTAYYQHERVALGLGLEPRPPHPLGYPLESGDLSKLEAVRRRGRLFREC